MRPRPVRAALAISLLGIKVAVAEPPASEPQPPKASSSPSTQTSAPPRASPPEASPPPPYGAYPGQAYPYPRGYYPYPPGYYASPPPPPPNAHSHSGFFLRMSLGGAYTATSAEIAGGNAAGKVDASGGGGALGLDIGGALRPGLILAGSFAYQAISDADLKHDTRPVRLPRNPQASLLALMVDWYPDPKQGFHVGAGIGLAGLGFHEDANLGTSGNTLGGLGFLPHVGYEWWVGNYWGIGVLGRFLLARVKGDHDGGSETDAIVGTSIAFSATYN